MKNVKIIVISESKDVDETLKTVSYGKMAVKEGKNYVIYEETEDSGLKGTKTIMKWNEKGLNIIRSGAIEHRQEMSIGVEDISIYKTPYMNIDIKTKTYVFEISQKNGVYEIHSEYTMVIGDEKAKNMKLDIVIKED